MGVRRPPHVALHRQWEANWRRPRVRGAKIEPSEGTRVPTWLVHFHMINKDLCGLKLSGNDN